jgi:glycerophosphoryl diester phosphodiesterase
MSRHLNRRNLLTQSLSVSVFGGAFAAAGASQARAASLNTPLITAHRGASGYRPEHTSAAYELAIKMGADFIEPDLVSTKDGHLVVRHDPILADSTDIAAHPEFADRKKTVKIAGFEITDWFVADFTLAEIKTLRARQVFPARDHSYDGQYQILTLQEVIDIANAGTKQTGRQIGVYPETKWPTLHQSLGLPLEPKLLDILAKAGLTKASSPVIIQSFEQANLKALKTKTEARLMQLISGSGVDPLTGQVILKAPDNKPFDWSATGRDGTYADMLTPAGLDEVAAYASIIAPWKGWIIGIRADAATGAKTLLKNQTLVDNAHARGLKVHTWTMRNDPTHLDAYYKGDAIAEYLEFFGMGVDGVFSDFPDTAVAARAKYLASRKA